MHCWLPREFLQRHVNDILVFHCPFYFLALYSRLPVPRGKKNTWLSLHENSEGLCSPREMESPLGFGTKGPGFAP